MNKRPYDVAVALACLGLLLAPAAHANTITPTDLTGLVIGDEIVGPAGPRVENHFTFTDTAGDKIGIAFLSSSVSCDSRFTNGCTAGAVSSFSDVVYTYQHEVTPGADVATNPPFMAPDAIVAFDDVTEFRLQFPAHGFLGVAGFDFDQATTAIGGVGIGIEQLADGSLSWTVPAGWGTGDPITFFWQSTQRPTGPTGLYATTNQTLSGVAFGPIPAVPEPATAVLMLAGLAVLENRRRARAKRAA